MEKGQKRKTKAKLHRHFMNPGGVTTNQNVGNQIPFVTVLVYFLISSSLKCGKCYDDDLP